MSTPAANETTEVTHAPLRSARQRWSRRLLAATLSVALALLAWSSGRALATSSLTRHVLRVRAIETTGLVRTSRELALASAGVAMNQSILTVPLQHGVEALEDLPWVRRAAIRRQLPDRVAIEVQEHEATLTVQLGELWLVNAAGEPFKRFSGKDGVVLPMVTGLQPRPQRELAYGQQPALVALLQEAMRLSDALLQCRDDIRHVEELHHDPDLGWSVVVLPKRGRPLAGEQDGVTAHLGKAPLDRLPVLLAALTELSDRRLEVRAIWAANERQSGRVQVQLKPAEG